MSVYFNHDNEGLVSLIVARWMLVKTHMDLPNRCAQSSIMDLMAANGVNGNPRLDLQKLAAFDAFNFAHDMSGIERYMNRETGKLEGCFLPRCALLDAEVSHD